MGKKKLGRLMPIKKTVIDPRAESGTVDRTYYIDPNKDVRKERDRKVEPQNDSNRSSISKEHEGESHKLTPQGLQKIEKSPKSENDVKLEPQKGVSDHEFSDVKDFEDFGKKGIDPEAARIFFCRM